jgi:hypothetical protein
MKRFIYLFIILLAGFASCKKNVAELPVPATNKSTTSTTTKTSTDGLALPAAGKFTPINFNIPDQTAGIKRDGSTLTITYNADVTLLTQTASLQKSYAVHFKEDFSASDLGKFDYHSLTKEGVNALNWVDDNLNNIYKTEKDTTLNNVAVTKIEVTRTFTFTHTFETPEQAVAAYNMLIADKTQNISFSAYYAPVDPNSVNVIGKANIFYIATH